MIKRNLKTIIAFVLVLMAPVASQANMAPPPGYWTGVSVEKIQTGLRVTSVKKGSAAERAGLRTGDVVLGIDGRYAKTFSDSDIKEFTSDWHSWPMDLIIARDDQVISLRIGN